MKYFFTLLPALLFFNFLTAQSLTQKLETATKELAAIEEQKQKVSDKIELLKLEKIRQQLDEIGLPSAMPGDEIVKHSAYILSFVPEYKQARWVAHIITPDVVTGVVTRTNDFRTDSLVRSGTAVEADYFLQKQGSDGKIIYDGFGYDRGHLAPSADFRWSRRALSESYLYSNMSPQLPEFNRGSWGDLEDALRGYIYRNRKSLVYVVTGPVLDGSMKKIERGVNKIPVPARFFKVAIDPLQKRGIGFIMPNENITKPVHTFAVSIDSVEKLTGLDFFNRLPPAEQEAMETQLNASAWLPERSLAGVEPLSQEAMPRNHFNTTLAKQFTKRNEVITVCGTVVNGRLSRAGNVLINLDQPFPDQVFTVFIKKEDIINFKYQPEIALQGKVVCVKGKVIDLGGTPTMYISSESDLSIQ